MKSNPVVFPFVEFQDLSNKKIIKNFLKPKIIDWDEIKNILSSIKKPYLNLPKKANIEEKIFDIFLDDNFLFGKKNYVLDYKKYWIEKLSYFTKNKKQIKFTLLGFPFKAPLILKTIRTAPDMGDVLVLNQLKNFVLSIKEIYNKGAIIYVVTEGCFGRFTGIKIKNIKKYHQFLNEIINELDFENFIKIIPLDKLETYDDFKKIYKEQIINFKEKYLKKDDDFIKKYKNAFPSIFRIVNPDTRNILFLMDVYNRNLETKDKKINKKRKELQERTHKAIIKYFSYLKTRDILNFLEKEVPNGLSLSVSPKPGRIGLLPINKEINKLPHHAMTVFYEKENKFLLHYYIDILRMNLKFQPVYLMDDVEKRPFFFIAYE